MNCAIDNYTQNTIPIVSLQIISKAHLFLNDIKKNVSSELCPL